MKIHPFAFLKWFCFLLWSLFALGYFFYRFPVRNFVEVLLSGTTLFLLVCWFIVVGHRMLQAFRVEYTSFSEEVSLSFGVGTGVTIFAVFLLATFHLLYEPLIVVLVLLIGGILYHDAKTFFIRGHSLAVSVLRQPHSPGELALMAFIGLATLLTFIGAATPTFFFDALYYHLAVPHKYLLHHGFHYIPHQEFSNLPFNLGMLFIVAMSFSKTLLPQLFSWVFTPMTALMIYAVAKEGGEKRIGLLSAAIFFFVPGVLTISTITSVEGALMYYTIFSLAAFLRYVKSSSRWWFTLSAIFCSLAAGTKYTAFVTTIAGMGFLALGHEYFVKKRGIVGAMKTLVLFGVIIGLGMSPWLIKNIVYTGNPMYPFFQSLFNRHTAVQSMNFSNIFTLDVNPLYLHVTTILRDGTGWMALVTKILTVPWDFTMKPTGAAGKTGVIFFLCLPFLLFLPKYEPRIRYVLGFSAVAFIGWMLALPWLQRYADPILPALSIVFAYLICHIAAPTMLKRFMFGGVLFLLSYQGLLFLIEERQVLRQFDYFLQNQSQEEFLRYHDVPYYPAMQYINAQTPPDVKILFVGESRGYYCERDYLLYAPSYGAQMDEIPLRQFIHEAADIFDLQQRLRQIGVTHLLLNLRAMRQTSEKYFNGKPYLWFADSKDNEIYQALFSPQFTNVVYSQHEMIVYELLFQSK